MRNNEAEANKEELAILVSQLIGKEVRRLRLQKDYSIEELAHRSRLSYSYVGEIERGSVKNISFLTILLLSYGFDFKPEYFTKKATAALDPILLELDKEE